MIYQEYTQEVLHFDMEVNINQVNMQCKHKEEVSSRNNIQTLKHGTRE